MRKRYTFAGQGATVPKSFRISEAADALLQDRVAKLVAAGELKNQSEALSDALVVWLMIEEHQEELQEELRAAAQAHPAGVALEELVDEQGG